LVQLRAETKAQMILSSEVLARRRSPGDDPWPGL